MEIGIIPLAQERCARAGCRFRRADFVILTVCGGAQAALRVRGNSGLRARLCFSISWLRATIVHKDTTDSLTYAQTTGNTRTGLRAVGSEHVSHVEKKCDVNFYYKSCGRPRRHHVGGADVRSTPDTRAETRSIRPGSGFRV